MQEAMMNVADIMSKARIFVNPSSTIVDAAHQMAENTPAVHAVRHHLVFLDPASGIAFPEI
jgi:CBS domain-containing protein